jgi:hypothetical protein
VGSPVASYRSQAARRAACSSRATLGDLAGLPLLMNAPWPHCEQIRMRGRDAALAAPVCPQLGQAIRVSMSVTTAAAGVGARGRSGSPGRRFCHRQLERVESVSERLAERPFLTFRGKLDWQHPDLVWRCATSAMRHNKRAGLLGRSKNSLVRIRLRGGELKGGSMGLSAGYWPAPSR